MTKTFSTKLDEKVLKLLHTFCKRHHIKMAHLLEEIIQEGIQKRTQTLELAESIRRGLEDENEGNLYTENEVEELIIGTKKKG